MHLDSPDNGTYEAGARGKPGAVDPPSAPPHSAHAGAGAGSGADSGAGYDAVVVAGGGARRFGGADKPSLTVGGRSLLDRVLAACHDASTTVVVGPRRPTHRPVTWTREEPPGSGPLAALWAGLRHVEQATVLVLSADLPFLGQETVRSLLALPGAEGVDGADGAEAAVAHDGQHDQPLFAAYRTEPLRRELALLHTEYGTLNHLPLRLLLPGLRPHRVTSPDAADCDTWEELAAARARIREHGSVLDEWIAAVKAELGIELDVDTAGLLDLARDAAHGVARPAAPLTTFLVGYAAAARGDGSPEAVARMARQAAELAARWEAESTEVGPTRTGREEPETGGHE